MSIYHARRKQSAGAGKLDSTPAASDALELVGAKPEAPPPQNMAWLRRARPVEYMLPATIKWYESLPLEVRPMALGMQYARIANLLAQQWNDDKACRAYFEDLLMGRRSKRRGFPPNVRRELWLLREYYQRTRMKTDGQLEIV
jgi:hypothetical protein